MELTGYQKRYHIRRAVPGTKSLIVAFPYEVVERKARELNMSVDDFLESYSAIVEYDHDFIHYTLTNTPEE